MVERRPLATFLAHLVLILGIVVVAFPIWVTFVASTHHAEDIMTAPIPLWPGTQFFQNYRTLLFDGLGLTAAAPARRVA